MLSLSVVIPSHNRPELLRLCLAAVTRHAPPDCEIIVVDDASPDQVISKVARQFTQVSVLRLEKRGGFAVAINAGVRAASGDIVEVLNDDTEVQSGWAEQALAAFADPGIGAVAPLVLMWPKGTHIDSAGDSYFAGGVASKRGHGMALTEMHMERREVFGASASSAFYRRSALLGVGAFPESFGAYFEDVDVAFRLQSDGWRTLFVPTSRVLHRVSASYGTSDPDLLKIQSRNEERVFWRNMPAKQLLWAVPLHLAVLAAKAVRRWREGNLLPFLRGRFAVVGEWREIQRHRRHLKNSAQPLLLEVGTG